MQKKMLKVVSLILCLSLLFCSGVSANAASGEISRVSCTVNGDASSSMGFCWYTPGETDTKIIIYDNGGHDVTADLSVNVSCSAWQGSYVHKATVTGLTAGSDYTYKVGDGMNWSETGSFVTDDGDDNVNFIVVGDVQASNLENFQAAAEVVKTAFDTMPDASFYATLGDFTNDSTNEQWSDYAEAFKNINTNTALVPITGNHDSDANWFNNMFNLDTSESVQTRNGVNYSFDYGNIHFAVVNTNDMISISDAQLTWLRNDMNSTSCDWKIVLMHKAPYSLGKDGKWPDAQYLQNSLAKVCDETNVDLVMSGHDHMYLRTKALFGNNLAESGAGTTYVLAGTPGTKRYEIRTFSIDRFMSKSFVETCVVQKTGYGNYFNGTDFDSVDESNIGGCFNTVSVSGGELTLKSYIVSDADSSVKTIDTFSITKEQGENTATFTGDNTTSTVEYAGSGLTTVFNLLCYAVIEWLPKFICAIPEIIYTYATTGTF